MSLNIYHSKKAFQIKAADLNIYISYNVPSFLFTMSLS